jgi:transposase
MTIVAWETAIQISILMALEELVADKAASSTVTINLWKIGKMTWIDNVSIQNIVISPRSEV